MKLLEHEDGFGYCERCLDPINEHRVTLIIRDAEDKEYRHEFCSVACRDAVYPWGGTP